LEDKPDVYHFVFTNPLNSKNSSATRKDSILDPNLRDIFDEVDKRAIIDFTVNKNSTTLEKIYVKYQNTKYMNLDVIVDSNIKFDLKDFSFNNTLCSEIKDLNSTTSNLTNLAKDVLMNNTKKFLP
jgi:hypothetical protein